MKSRRCLWPFVAITLLLTGCSALGGSDSEPSGQPSLSAGDFPDVTPCSNRDILPSDGTFLKTLTDATQVLHIFKKYVNDANLPAVCGLAAEDNALEQDEIGWDPSAGTDVNNCNSFQETVTNFLASTGYNPGMCRSTYGVEVGNILDGFPRAGTYRLDACLDSGGKSYGVRLRVTVSGTDVNKTWAKAGVASADSLKVFNTSGSELATVSAVKALFIANPEATTFTIRSDSGKKTHLTVESQIICVRSRVSCPAATAACSS